jgi:hypothetical protein
MVLYVFKVPGGTKEPFWLKELGISKDWEVKQTLLRRGFVSSIFMYGA